MVQLVNSLTAFDVTNIPILGTHDVLSVLRVLDDLVKVKYFSA